MRAMTRYNIPIGSRVNERSAPRRAAPSTFLVAIGARIGVPATLGCLVLVLGWGAGPASAVDFYAGAGQAATTPPSAGSVANDPALGPCGGAPFGQGQFALQEPFIDQNGNRQWDPGFSLTGAPSGPPEPYCDNNGNGHWDGIYADNNNGPVTTVHDDIEARAVAIADGRDKPVVYVSVAQIGVFDYYTDLARADLAGTYKDDADLVVSANHNESSPDSIGLYGALTTPLGVGLRSGVDEYYMNYLADRIASAAHDAIHHLQPAQLYASQAQGPIPDGQSGSLYPLLSGLSQRISDQFPTSVANPTIARFDNRVAAVDTKMGVLQARRPDGTPIFTIMSQAAHNQEMGHAGAIISADWPGSLQRSLDARLSGLSMFLVGDNGSEEDPQTDPPLIDNGADNNSGDPAIKYPQAQATGQRFADNVIAAASVGQRLTPGTVRLDRQQICVPLENNGFVALAAAGEFGRRQGYACDPSGNPVAPVPNGAITPTASNQFRTYVGYTNIGPDLQLIHNPGEAFPALMLGSPFGQDEESCPRPNPAVPTWHANGVFRLQVGLADDLIGYLIPAWAFATGNSNDPSRNPPGLFNNDSCYVDQAGHRHKLESESVGPTGANDVANRDAAMLDAQKDAAAHIAPGRFVLANGTYSHWPTGAVGILVPDAGASALDPASGTLIGAPGTAGFGGRAVDATGVFMDYDGEPQPGPDITTRGMMTFAENGCVAHRYYLDVFPRLGESNALGGRRADAGGPPNGDCTAPGAGGITPIGIEAGIRAGVLPASAAAGLGQLSAGRATAALSRRARCAGPGPRSAIAKRIRLGRGRLRLSGRARGGRCARVVRVSVSIERRARGGCRFVLASGRLGRRRSCRRPVRLLARGTSRWRLALRLHVPSGRYTVRVGAVDRLGRQERPRRHGNVSVLGIGRG